MIARGDGHGIDVRIVKHCAKIVECLRFGVLLRMLIHEYKYATGAERERLGRILKELDQYLCKLIREYQASHPEDTETFKGIL